MSNPIGHRSAKTGFKVYLYSALGFPPAREGRSMNGTAKKQKNLTPFLERTGGGFID